MNNSSKGKKIEVNTINILKNNAVLLKIYHDVRCIRNNNLYVFIVSYLYVVIFILT